MTRALPRPPRSPDMTNPVDVQRWTRELKDYLDRVAADIVANAADAAGLQSQNDILDALVDVGADEGLIEKTDAAEFATREIGVRTSSSIPTRADADGRYARSVSGHQIGDWTSNADAAVNGYVTLTDSLGNTRKLATIA